MNSVIDLMFLQDNSVEINNHFILPELSSPSDHTSLIVDIIINEGFFQNKWWAIIKNRERVHQFKNTIDNIDTSNISNKESLKERLQEYLGISLE